MAGLGNADRAAPRNWSPGPEMKTGKTPGLDADTLREIQRAYSTIRNTSGYGTIRIRIEQAGGKRESHFVAVELERKTK